MATDKQLAPTDAELAALAVEINRTDWDDAMDALICFARAVLARWGQPAHSGEPVAWLNPWRADQVTTDYDAYGKHGIPLYTAPQPVEREPLTDGQIKELIEDGMFLGNCKEIVRAIERVHGITQRGGQHGTDT